MLPTKATILRLLYYSPEPLSEDSLVTRISPIREASRDTVGKDVHQSLLELSRDGLCKVTTIEGGKTAASLTEEGVRSLVGGHDERLEIRKAPSPPMADEIVSTGIPGLDEITGGGIPSGSVVLVRGPPGSGKTILSGQFLHAGIGKFDHNGVFVSFDVPKADFLKQMRDLGLDFEKVGNRFEFVDAVPIRLVASDSLIQTDKKGRVAVVSLCEEIERKVEETEAKRIVIDTLTSLSMLYGDSVERRMGMLALFEALHKLGCTALVTAEAGEPNVIEPEEYLSDGVIHLERLLVGRAIIRAMSVYKMRRRSIDMQPRPYRITMKGIEVFSKESVY